MGELKKLSFAELAELDGKRIAIAFDQALKRAAEDCDDRPGEKRPRKVTLEIQFIPAVDEQGICERVKSAIQIQERIPTRKSKVYDFGLRRGMLTYQPDSLDDHSQDSFDFDSAEKESDQ